MSHIRLSIIIVAACLFFLPANTLAINPGDPVTSFGAGFVRDGFGPGSDSFKAVALQPDGKIVAAGTSHNGSINVFVVARYLSDGSPDASFGSGGSITTAVGFDDNAAHAVAIDGSGNIVVAGTSYSSGGGL